MHRTLTAALIPFMLAVPAHAVDGDAGRGAVLFGENCAGCHGVTAMGDGPMAEILSIAPPDLTGLAQRTGGAFRADDVVRQIDGRDMILSHGGPMPIFGHILEGGSAVVDDVSGAPVFTTSAVLDIVTWLEDIQR